MGLVFCRKTALKHPSPRGNSSLGELCLPQEHGSRSATNAATKNISETLPVRLKLWHSPAKTVAVMNRAVKSTASITWQVTRASGFISMPWPAGEQIFRRCLWEGSQGINTLQTMKDWSYANASGLGVILSEKYQKFFFTWNRNFFLIGSLWGTVSSPAPGENSWNIPWLKICFNFWGLPDDKSSVEFFSST